MEETAQYMANGATHGIIIISADEAKEIIETREPRGLFLYIENGYVISTGANGNVNLVHIGNIDDTKIIGIDNRTGDAWTESFDTYEDCVKWLIDPDREAQEEAEPMHYNYPRVKFVDTNQLHEQLDHVESEMREIVRVADEEELIMELLDLQHSVETAIRILQEKHGVDVEAYRQAVIEKNRRRGYYNTTAKADTAAEAMARIAEHDGTADKMARGE
jgi:hypothetical protein